MAETPAKVGDIVVYVNSTSHYGGGALYRVASVSPTLVAELTLVFGAFPGGRKKKRTAHVDDCRKVTVEEMREASRLLEAVIAGEENGVR